MTENTQQNTNPRSNAVGARRKQELIDRDAAITDRDAAITDRDAAITDRDAALNDRRSAIRNLNLADSKNQILQQKIETLLNTESERDHFVASISHDLRTPITAIKMAGDWLRWAEPTDFDEALDMIDKHTAQAFELIEHLLDVNLIKSGRKLPLTIKKCDLTSIIRNSIETLENGERQSIEVDVENKEVWGYWDPFSLNRAFKNLISNAIKFGNSSPIQISVKQGPDIVSVAFRNFGPTISLADQIKIFDSHFRSNAKTAKETKGWGLGLTLVKGISEAHNGKVDVTSSEIDGTIFTIHLPNDSRDE